MYKYLVLITVLFIVNCTNKNSKKMSAFKYTNSLIKETSPYLLQHAHNPVNWYAWNNETLELAKKEKKLIIISIGYSSCHWCHVMEHESFENESVAAVMNKNFICIKVDREERPDVDQVYMNAVQLMTGSGGWPLNCVALPDGRPVWGGTYFSKENWISALNQLSKLYIEEPKKLEDYATQLTNGVKNSQLIQLNTSKEKFDVKNLKTAVKNWEPSMDFNLGGRKGAPKFPMPTNYEFLLQYAFQAKDTKILDYVNTSLTNMALGGIYDQIGGGFARYSVDSKWHIPHFEKMLYDNAQLVSVYSNAYKVTKNQLYKNIVYQTLTFIEREMMSKEGAFYSALDADSNNKAGKLEEGAYYVWTKEELKSLLKKDFVLFSDYYNVNNYGYWEKDNYVLIRKNNEKEICKTYNISESELQNKVIEWQKTLLNERSKREKPRLDDKSLTSWNAIMLKGYIDAYTAFNDVHFLEIAKKNAAFIQTKQLQENGSLHHSYKNGISTINGYLEDYASVIDAYIALYQATLNENWLTTAKELTDYSLDHFFDEKTSMFYFTSNEDPALLTRKIETEDNVIPSSNSIMAKNLFKLSHYYSNNYYLKVSKQMLKNVTESSEQYGSAFSNWLQLGCYLSGNYYEIAISGKDALINLPEFSSVYLPNVLIAGSTSESNIPLMEERYFENETLYYLCVDSACKLPQKEPQKIINEIKTEFK